MMARFKLSKVDFSSPCPVPRLGRLPIALPLMGARQPKHNRPGWIGLSSAALALLSLLACAETPAAKAPSAAAPTGSAGSAAANANANAVQSMGISDAPTGGQASSRPKLNPQAAQQYVAAMQAFQAGTLDVAEGLFEKTIELDPKAYQAYYSLGVIRARLRTCHCRLWNLDRSRRKPG
jgi:TolA-binding protein